MTHKSKNARLQAKIQIEEAHADVRTIQQRYCTGVSEETSGRRRASGLLDGGRAADLYEDLQLLMVGRPDLDETEESRETES